MKHYDIAVVGSGPTGSTLSRYLADKGFNVAIFEKKKTIGVPLQCAGLVGKKIKKVNILPEKFILKDIYGAHIHSPSELCFSVGKENPEAYVLDRMAYDKFLACTAIESGAELFMKHKVTAVDSKKGIIYFKNSNDSSISADIVVGADGYNSMVSKTFNKPPNTFKAAQHLIKVESDAFNDNYVHVHADAKISPGFIWIIPLPEKMVRVGLFSNFNYQEMNTLLKDFINKHPDLQKGTVLKKYYGHIPIYDPKKEIVNERVLLLGDAASQVKPTSGGGLILGFNCAQIASETISNALEQDNIALIKNYKSKYDQMFKKELKMQLKVQKIFQSLNNQDIDYMFQKLIDEGAPELISKYGDIDTQSPLIREMIKRGLMFSILPKLLSRGISSLWK